MMLIVSITSPFPGLHARFENLSHSIKYLFNPRLQALVITLLLLNTPHPT